MPYRFWTPKDINLLQHLYIKKGLSKTEIAPYFPERTPEAIWIKIKKLKFRHVKKQTSQIKSRLNSGCKNAMYGKVSFKKGLTKYTSDKIRKAGEKLSITRKLGFKTGRFKAMKGSKNPMYGRPAWSRGLTKSSSNKILEASKKQSITKKAIWKNLPEKEKEKRSIFLASLFRYHKKGVRTSIELAVQKILEKLSVKFKPSYPMGRFFVDFYLPEYNSVIECQGDYWHCNPVVYKTADKYQSKNMERDERKKKYLKENNIPLLFLWEKDIKQSQNTETTIINFLKLNSVPTSYAIK